MLPGSFVEVLKLLKRLHKFKLSCHSHFTEFPNNYWYNGADVWRRVHRTNGIHPPGSGYKDGLFPLTPNQRRTKWADPNEKPSVLIITNSFEKGHLATIFQPLRRKIGANAPRRRPDHPGRKRRGRVVREVPHLSRKSGTAAQVEKARFPSALDSIGVRMLTNMLY